MWILIALTIFAYGDLTTQINATQLRTYMVERECTAAAESLEAGVGSNNPATTYLCRYVSFPVVKTR